MGIRSSGALPAFTKSFQSAQQTITSAGSLTIAHGLGVVPKLLHYELVCQTADLNYSVGDVLHLGAGFPGSTGATNRGMGLNCDATNINIRFGSTNPCIAAVNKTTGAYYKYW